MPPGAEPGLDAGNDRLKHVPPVPQTGTQGTPWSGAQRLKFIGDVAQDVLPIRRLEDARQEPFGDPGWSGLTRHVSGSPDSD